jgi:hypothetical protein
MPRSNIKLLVALVVLAAVTVVGTLDARTFGRGTSLSTPFSSIDNPPPDVLGGEPDVGGGTKSKTPPSRATNAGPGSKLVGFGWWQWTGRIWATWFWDAAH